MKFGAIDFLQKPLTPEAHHAGGNLFVLLLDCLHHVAGREVESSELFGSSQIRIEYSEPKIVMLPTPLIRASVSLTCSRA